MSECVTCQGSGEVEVCDECSQTIDECGCEDSTSDVDVCPDCGGTGEDEDEDEDEAEDTATDDADGVETSRPYNALTSVAVAAHTPRVTLVGKPPGSRMGL